MKSKFKQSIAKARRDKFEHGGERGLNIALTSNTLKNAGLAQA
ncbi:hypothetical protein CAMGR0001_0995 [Campylobacter gracilis RM3268]|uniref:Uncharacterized protein n=1 Tax=Campylobacter gracilis RM3268 TaxID=553220 RepID=C8PGJ9_9BACT|nr:hypothetical protein CAMGR0001_0995 [Campylobacter gracilis RM3268]